MSSKHHGHPPERLVDDVIRNDVDVKHYKTSSNNKSHAVKGNDHTNGVDVHGTNQDIGKKMGNSQSVSSKTIKSEVVSDSKRRHSENMSHDEVPKSVLPHEKGRRASTNDAMTHHTRHLAPRYPNDHNHVNGDTSVTSHEKEHQHLLETKLIEKANTTRSNKPSTSGHSNTTQTSKSRVDRPQINTTDDRNTKSHVMPNTSRDVDTATHDIARLRQKSDQRKDRQEPSAQENQHSSCLCPAARRKSIEYSRATDRPYIEREDTELEPYSDTHGHGNTTRSNKKHSNNKTSGNQSPRRASYHDMINNRHEQYHHDNNYQVQQNVTRSFARAANHEHIGRSIHVEDWAIPKWIPSNISQGLNFDPVTNNNLDSQFDLDDSRQPRDSLLSNTHDVKHNSDDLGKTLLTSDISRPYAKGFSHDFGLTHDLGSTDRPDNVGSYENTLDGYRLSESQIQTRVSQLLFLYFVKTRLRLHLLCAKVLSHSHGLEQC